MRGEASHQPLSKAIAAQAHVSLPIIEPIKDAEEITLAPQSVGAMMEDPLQRITVRTTAARPPHNLQMQLEKDNDELPFIKMAPMVIIPSKGDTTHSRVVVENAVAEVVADLDQATRMAINLPMDISPHSPHFPSQWDPDHLQSSILRITASSPSPRGNTAATRIAHSR